MRFVLPYFDVLTNCIPINCTIMPNRYIGTNTNQLTDEADDTLRSGYDKKMADDSTALNAQMGSDPVTTETHGASGTQWGAYTACGGMVVKTLTEVYIIHSTPSKYLKDQWNISGNWLCDNKARITQAILINFGNNAENAVTDPIWNYLVQNHKAAYRISRPLNTTALRASANLDGVFIMKKVDYTHPIVNVNWGDMDGQTVITVNS